MSFTLPYRCDCGARASITIDQYDDENGEPQPMIINVEGPFRVVGLSNLSCQECGDSDETKRVGL